MENHELSYSDELDYESNWIENFDGLRFRFDNMPNGLPGEDFETIYDLEWHADSNMINNIYFDLSYFNAASYAKRLNFDYKVEFSTTVLDTANATTPPSGCADRPTKTVLPFPAACPALPLRP